MFGIATGIAAYAIWERDPRNAHDHGPGNRLWDLINRRLGLSDGVQDAKHLSQTASKDVANNISQEASRISNEVSKEVTRVSNKVSDAVQGLSPKEPSAPSSSASLSLKEPGAPSSGAPMPLHAAPTRLI